MPTAMRIEIDIMLPEVSFLNCHDLESIRQPSAGVRRWAIAHRTRRWSFGAAWAASNLPVMAVDPAARPEALEGNDGARDRKPR